MLKVWAPTSAMLVLRSVHGSCLPCYPRSHRTEVRSRIDGHLRRTSRTHQHTKAFVNFQNVRLISVLNENEYHSQLNAFAHLPREFDTSFRLDEPRELRDMQNQANAHYRNLHAESVERELRCCLQL